MATTVHQGGLSAEKADEPTPSLRTGRAMAWRPGLAASLTVAFVVLGAALRLYAYLRRPALWLDEVSIAFNLHDRGFHGLARPLEWNQAAPVGWLWLEKICYDVFGSSEYALRLPSLVAALLLLVGTAVLGRQLLPKAYAWVPVAIVAMSPRLIEYSHELKPYSSDTLAVTGLVLCTVFVHRFRRLWTLLLWGAVAAVSAAVSLPALLAAGGGCLVLLVACARDAFRFRTPRALLLLACAALVQVPWALIAEWERQHFDPNTVSGADFWAPGYPRTLLGLPRWLPGATSRLGAYFQLRPSALLLPVVLVGLVALVRSAVLHRTLGRLTPLLLLLAAALGAAGLQLYPFMQRAALYLVAPIAVIVAAIPTLVDGASRRRHLIGQVFSAVIVAVVAVLWIGATPTSGGGGLKVPAEPPLAFLRSKVQPGDVVVVHRWASNSYSWYGHQLALPPGLVMLPTSGKPCSDRPAADRLAPARRMWAVAIDRPSSGPMTQQGFFGAADRLGTPLTTYSLPSGSRIVLYQLTPPAAVPTAKHTGACPVIVSGTPAPTTPRAPIWR